MRFAGAANEGLNEQRVALIQDGFEQSDLPERDKLILAYTDLFLNNPSGIHDNIKARMRENFSDEQIVELTAGLALFMGFSKIAISLGGMPAELPTMEMPTPE